MASAPKLLGYLSIDHPDPMISLQSPALAADVDLGCDYEGQTDFAFPRGSNPFLDPTPDDSAWSTMVDRVRGNDPGAMEDLYELFVSGVRFMFCRQLGTQNLQDYLHDAFVIVVERIQSGELRDPTRLMGYIRTVVRRMVAAQINAQVRRRKERTDSDYSNRVSDERSNPEQDLIFRQKVDLVRRVLAEMPERDQEILRRFYIEEESQDAICAEMGLTVTQFRLMKYRAKLRFGDLGRKMAHGRLREQILLRISGG